MAATLTAWRQADDHYFDPEDAPADTWRSRQGTVPVCLSAPHAVAQVRDGKAKIADLYTGGLVEACAAAADCGFMATQGAQTGDPNWDSEHPYRRRLRALAGGGAVLDIHGMRDDRGVAINIGVCSDTDARVRRLVALLVEASLAVGILEVGVNYPFRGGGRTLTAWMQKNGIACVQIELARSLRDYTAKPDTAARTLEFLDLAVDAAASVATDTRL